MDTDTMQRNELPTRPTKLGHPATCISHPTLCWRHQLNKAFGCWVMCKSKDDRELWLHAQVCSLTPDIRTNLHQRVHDLRVTLTCLSTRSNMYEFGTAT